MPEFTMCSTDELRRLDWRFLISDVSLAQVAYVADPASSLVGALRAVCPSVVDLRKPAAVRWYPLVVVGGADLRSLATAARAVSPGGWLYAEFTRRPFSLRGRLRHPSRCRRELCRRGFDRVVASWHRPDFVRTIEIVPLDQRAGQLFTMSRAAVSWQRRVHLLVGRFLVRTGLLPFVVPCFSVVGQKRSTAASEQ